MDSEVLAALADLSRKMEDLKQELGNRLTKLDSRVQQLDVRIQRLDDRIDFLELGLQALDRLPPLIHRPRSFHGATEFISVSAPVRRRLGQMG